LTSLKQLSPKNRSGKKKTVPLDSPMLNIIQQYLKANTIPLTPLTKSAVERMQRLEGTRVQKDDEWINVWEKMKYTGWMWKQGTGSVDFYYLPPGGDTNGKEGVDYFTSFLDVKRFAYEHFEWGGDDTFFREINNIVNVLMGQSGRDRENMVTQPAPPTTEKARSPHTNGTKKDVASKDGKEEGREFDEDGSFKVPGFLGVWMNPAGQYFLKVNSTTLFEEVHEKKNPDGTKPLYFESPEGAACHYDSIVPAGAQRNYFSNGKRIVYQDKAPVAVCGGKLKGSSAFSASVLSALSVINIKDLPKDIKPLLSDPKQHWRSGNTYRGACRQGKKENRWRSRIYFRGAAYKLGTYDSEWDAARIFAWAYLILHGEEATKKIQREAEEAWKQGKNKDQETDKTAPVKEKGSSISQPATFSL